MIADNFGRLVRFEPEERCPVWMALLVGSQGSLLMLAPTVLNVAIAVRASGLAESHVAWSVFASLVICAGITALQSTQSRRFGAGHIVLSGPSAMFIAIMVLTVSEAGLATFASLMVVCSLIQIAIAWWLPTVRRVVTPTVLGTVVMVIAVSVMPIAFDQVGNLPAEAPSAAGAVIAGVTLLSLAMLTLRSGGRWRTVAPFISILAGCAAAAAFGVLDGSRIDDAGWFGVPAVPDFGVDLVPTGKFWLLLPSFAILTVVLGLKTISDGVVIQEGSRRKRQAIEFQRIQGMVGANGVGMLFAGMAGTLPTVAYSSFSFSLINLTGVAARRVGASVAVVTVMLALCSKLTAVLLTIPGPVLAAELMFALGMLFASGCRTVVRDGIDARRTLVVALGATLGLGLHGHPLMRDIFGEEFGDLLGNGVTVAAISAIAMTLLTEVVNGRRARLEVKLDATSIPALDEFLVGVASRLGWNEASSYRLRSVGEEAFATLLSRQGDDDGSQSSRLIVAARPQADMVELELVSTSRTENIEDQVALLTYDDAVPTVENLSLRLLRFHSSALRHQKFHGIEIITVHVEGRS